MEPLAFEQYTDVVQVGGYITQTTGLHIMPIVDDERQSVTYWVGASPDGVVIRRSLHEYQLSNKAMIDDDDDDDDDDDIEDETAEEELKIEVESDGNIASENIDDDDDNDDNDNDDEVSVVVDSSYHTTRSTSNTGLLEIKSLWGRRNSATLPRFEYCPNRFYDQIQTQLAVCKQDWCDLMCYIPPGGGMSSTGSKNSRRSRRTNTSSKNKRLYKMKKRLKQRRKERRDQEQLQQQDNGGPINHDHLIQWWGSNYCIVRVQRNETYWNETLKPAIIEFCRDVNDAVAVAAATTTTTTTTTAEEEDKNT
jgi:hypothetical protein